MSFLYSSSISLISSYFVSINFSYDTIEINEGDFCLVIGMGVHKWENLFGPTYINSFLIIDHSVVKKVSSKIALAICMIFCSSQFQKKLEGQARETNIY